MAVTKTHTANQQIDSFKLQVNKMTDSTEKALQDGVLTTGNFTIQAQMGSSGKALTISGYIYSHNTAEDINKQIDIYHDVVDRQQARASIPELEIVLERRIKALHQQKDSLTELRTLKDAKGKITSAQESMINNLTVSLVEMSKDVEKGREALSEAIAKSKKA